MTVSSTPSSWLLFLITAALMLAAVSLSGANSAAVFHLERSFPLNHSVFMEQMTARDRVRHGRFSRGSQDHGGVDGVVSFTVYGSADPDLFGLYYTNISLGSPPREFKVQIDTGSDLLWVKASTCANCPRTSNLIQLQFFDPTASSTSWVVPCSHKFCAGFNKTSAAWCSRNAQCDYTIRYLDWSETSGVYIRDMFHFDTMLPGSTATKSSSAPIVFGVSTYQSGGLGSTTHALTHGILGFGRGDLSVFTQLSVRGLIPKVFSHCLKGEGTGGVIFVLGRIAEPGIVYTPLVPLRGHYYVYLQGIEVNGRMLAVDPVVFSKSANHGTVVDSGTTFSYLTEEAYGPFVNAVTASVLQTTTPRASRGQRYLVNSTSSISQLFPSVSFHFAGGASLVLKPEDYLVQSVLDVAGKWCLGFGEMSRVTILGDLVLKNKIVVYDLVHQQIGWTAFNCSSAANVSMSGDDFIKKSLSSSGRDLLPGVVTLLLLFVILLS